MKPLLIFLLLVAGAASAQDQSRAIPAVEDFVKARNFHGIQYVAAARFGPEAVPPLRRILSDPGERNTWAAAVWVLGIIGTPEAADTLIEFHETAVEGVADPAALQALLLVPQALGFSANNPDSRAFSYLVDGLEAKTRDLPWTGSEWAPGSRALLLAKLSANGLGLAGNEAGRQVLSETRNRLAETDPERLRFLRSNIAEALELSGRIEELGYARALTPPPRPPGPRIPRQDDTPNQP